MDYINVGRLAKPYGIKGILKAVLEDTFLLDLKKSEVWFIDVDGEILPFFIESYQESTSFMVKFEDVDSPEEAKKIANCRILLQSKDITMEAEVVVNEYDKLLGFEIRSVDNRRIGIIVEIEEYPLQLMSFVDTESSQVLIPLVDAFMKSIDTKKKIIIMDLPSGLIESQK